MRNIFFRKVGDIMAGFIPNNIIDRILEESDIVEIIGSYISLKKSGRNYQALCPFHQERTPSFVVSPEKQLFHCFGCGVGGNVFTFLMKWEKASFPEAVKSVGEKIGISVPTLDKSGGYREDLCRINTLVADFFHQKLKENSFALNYLLKRGFKESIIDTFYLGYAPPSRDFLNFCSNKKISSDKLKALGLILPSKIANTLPDSPTREKDGYYAYFRSRIIFPVFTPTGKICGFGARVLDESLPKYLNSPQSPLFNKGENLYGLNLAKQFIREEKEVILVEGYTDVISLYQEGIRNVVASLGTSLTPSQAELLKRYTNKVHVAYDKDSAGESATLRGIDILLDANFQIKVISFFGGADPADFIQKKGRDAFIKVKEKSVSYFDYRLNLEVDQKPSLGLEDKLEIVDSLFLTLKKVKNQIVRREFIKRLASKLNIDEADLLVEFQKFMTRRNYSTFPAINSSSKKSEEKDRERCLLQVMLCGEEAVEVVKNEFSLDEFTNPAYREIAQEIIKIVEKGQLSHSKLISRIKDENLSSIVSSSALSNPSWKGYDKVEIAIDIINNFRRVSKQREIASYPERINESEKRGEEEKVRELIRQHAAKKKNFIKVNPVRKIGQGFKSN